MAEIMEHVEKCLREQVLPAARRFPAIAKEQVVAVCLRAEERLREPRKPEQAVGRMRDPADRAENHMVSPVPIAHADETVAKVRRRFSGQSAAFDFIELLFVTDDQHRLQGVVPLSKLLGATSQTTIKELMTGAVTSVTLGVHPEQVAEVALTHEIPAVPVVDDRRVLIGAVPAQKVFKLMREDHIQDMDRLVGIWRNSDQALSAIEGDPLRRVMNRLPWLIVGTVGCVLATGLMASFENTLRADLAVAFFIPGIVYLADAIGTQSEAIAVRGLSFSRTPIPQLLKGEMKTGLYLGIALALVVFPFIWLAFNALLAFAVSVALICASSVATSIGLLLPSILSRLGRDPAYGSGPVATIVQDLLSLLIYLSVIRLLII